MSLLDAPVYNPVAERRRKFRIAIIVAIAIVVVAVIYLNRFWPEVRVVNNFFAALEKKDYNSAYGIWMADPKWEQHPQQHVLYPFNEFYTDWGPGGEWGIINNHKIEGALQPKDAKGVVVSVIVNGRAEPAHIWVDKSDKTLSFYPY